MSTVTGKEIKNQNENWGSPQEVAQDERAPGKRSQEPNSPALLRSLQQLGCPDDDAEGRGQWG